MELDDGILDHPKFIRAVKLGGSEAIHLWLGIRAYCAKLLTDGKVPGDMLDEVRGPKDPKRRGTAFAALVTVGLLDPLDDGVQMHNYLKWSKSRAQVMAQREAARNRQTKFRGGNDTGSGGGNAGSNGVTSDVTSRTVPRSMGEEWSGDGEAPDLGSGSPGVADIKAQAVLWLKNAQAASLAHPNPENWQDTRVLSRALVDVFGGPEQGPRNSGDPRMQILFARWAEGRTTAELEQAIRGAGKDDHYRRNPQYQTFQTILKDSGQVDKFIRLLHVAPKRAAGHAGAALQNSHGKTGTENARRL